MLKILEDSSRTLFFTFGESCAWLYAKKIETLPTYQVAASLRREWESVMSYVRSAVRDRVVIRNAPSRYVSASKFAIFSLQ